MSCAFLPGAYLFLAAATATGLVYTLIYLLAILARYWRLNRPPDAPARLMRQLADDLLSNEDSSHDRPSR